MRLTALLSPFIYVFGVSTGALLSDELNLGLDQLSGVVMAAVMRAAATDPEPVAEAEVDVEAERPSPAMALAPVVPPAPRPLPSVGGAGWGQHAPTTQSPGQQHAEKRGLLRPNVAADFNPDIETPQVHESAYVDPLANVTGHVKLGGRVYVAPFASVRGDEGQPIHVGDESNLQDGVVIHALETYSNGQPVSGNSYTVDGDAYAVFVGERVSMAHQSQVHGPAWIEDDTFIGMQSMVFRSHVGRGVVIEPAVTIIGVNIPDGRYVPAGAVITTQDAADALPAITYSYGLGSINRSVVHVNTSLADGYSGRGVPASHAK